MLSEYEHSHHLDVPQGAGGREGTVLAVSGDTVFFDIGLKIEGTMPAAELRDGAGNLTVQPGDKLRVAIAGQDPEGYYLLSKIRAERPKDWKSLESAFEEKRPIAGLVTSVIKGGLSVDVGVRAFMPASRSGAKDTAEMEQLVGQEISCRIIKLDVGDEDVVVDRRAVLEEEEARAKEKLVAELKEGTKVRGTVRSLTDYGAFIDIGGVDGLLHVTDISWGRVNKPADVLSPGESLDVQILKIDPAKRRISLGMKQLQPHPWSLAGEKYKAGERVRGVVSRLADFGAFIEVEPGVEGLIHLSDMSWSKKVRKPSDVVNPGDSVEAVILGINVAERRLSLGLKQALGDPWEDVEQKYPVGSAVEGLVTNLTKFGAFVELGGGLEGMIHVSDMSAEKRVNHPQEVLKPGQSVRAAVLEVEKSKRRIRLGLKQLQPTTMDEYIAEHKPGDVVTGRVAEISNRQASIELGEGIHASCSLRETSSRDAENHAAESKPDLGSLTSMLTAKWKHGSFAAKGTSRGEPARAGQIRSFRIVRLDAGEKKIEVELAG
jgi:small subunit ribosomal protein S1